MTRFFCYLPHLDTSMSKNTAPDFVGKRFLDIFAMSILMLNN